MNRFQIIEEIIKALDNLGEEKLRFIWTLIRHI